MCFDILFTSLTRFVQKIKKTECRDKDVKICLRRKLLIETSCSLDLALDRMKFMKRFKHIVICIERFRCRLSKSCYIIIPENYEEIFVSSKAIENDHPKLRFRQQQNCWQLQVLNQIVNVLVMLDVKTIIKRWPRHARFNGSSRTHARIWSRHVFWTLSLEKVWPNWALWQYPLRHESKWSLPKDPENPDSRGLTTIKD